MQTVADYASVVIVNSHSTELSFREHCKRRHWRQPPVEVIPLGVDPLFMAGDAVPEIVAGTPYFVMVGTIEPRKNHLLLLHLWRRMVKQIGSNTPRLVIIGRRGWENENVADLLERCDLIRDHVIEANDLHDLHVAQLIRGATALLAPSFLEGYGLPVVEALSLGTPVIASDIPVHHDAGDGFVDFIDPLNGGEWLAAIAAHSQRSARNGVARCKTSGYNPPSWSNHFAQVELLLKRSFASVSRTSR
jgi:glycosyltransferase involved in cell wall biosynthesis